MAKTQMNEHYTSSTPRGVVICSKYFKYDKIIEYLAMAEIRYKTNETIGAWNSQILDYGDFRVSDQVQNEQEEK